MTRSVLKVTHQIEKLVNDALEELEQDGRICSEFNCICQNQFPNCPIMIL